MTDTTADTATTDDSTEADTATDGTTSTDDLARELEKWKSQSRKHEERAKANAAAAKQLEQLQQQSMNDNERAVAEARASATDEVRKVYGGRLVAAEVKAAAAGRGVDVDALIEAIDPARFLNDEGEPDAEAITAWVDRVAPIPEPPAPGTVNLGQGVRSDPVALALNGDPLVKALSSKLGIT